MALVQELRQEDGTLPVYAWPGGYPVIYLTNDGEVVCPACANGENGAEFHESAEGDWRLVFGDIHWEGAPEVCCHCNALIESAYGET